MTWSHEIILNEPIDEIILHWQSDTAGQHPVHRYFLNYRFLQGKTLNNEFLSRIITPRLICPMSDVQSSDTQETSTTHLCFSFKFVARCLFVGWSALLHSYIKFYFACKFAKSYSRRTWHQVCISQNYRGQEYGLAVYHDLPANAKTLNASLEPTPVSPSYLFLLVMLMNINVIKYTSNLVLYVQSIFSQILVMSPLLLLHNVDNDM